MKAYLQQQYARYERHLSSLALVGGFVFDALTLKRVDLWWENTWISLHLAIAGLGIVALNYYYRQPERRQAALPTFSRGFWLIFLVQFAFGGLLSAFLVFYFRSATLSAAWPFLLLLVLAFAVNESLRQRYSRLTYQVGMFFLSLFTLAIYLVPIVAHRLGAEIFVLSGLVSLIGLALWLWLLAWSNPALWRESRWWLSGVVVGLYLLFNLLYFANLIPPIPLSLQELGVYHQVTRVGDDYRLAVEDWPWWQRWWSRETIHLVAGQPLYVYSAVFAPTKLTTAVVHHWQYYDRQQGAWSEVSQVGYTLSGGRDNGYRGFSQKTSLAPGDWRVDVTTADGLLIGRVQFRLVLVNEAPPLTDYVAK